MKGPTRDEEIAPHYFAKQKRAELDLNESDIILFSKLRIRYSQSLRITVVDSFSHLSRLCGALNDASNVLQPILLILVRMYFMVKRVALNRFHHK